MSSFFIATIKINDITEYQKYLDGFEEIFQKYEGKVIAVDDSPITLEGIKPEGRFVIIKFPNEEKLKSWYYSPEYQQLSEFRKRASESNIILVKGRD